MDVVRITELQPKTYVEQGDYIAIDNQSDGTKKVQFTNLLDDTLSQENKIAPANVVGDEIATIRAAVGSPLKASTVAQMTNTNKIYVYVGSESGYTNGNWYYWNGSAWTSGGVYNSIAVVTDPTLTLSGVPADAKATGDEITDLKSELNDAKAELGFTYTDQFDATTIKSNNNSAVTNNNDGTYTFGTTDYGNTVFGEPAYLDVGYYELFGTPFGTTYVSVAGDYANRIATNNTKKPKRVQVSTAGNYALGVAILSAERPTTAFTTAPYLKKIGTGLDEIREDISNIEKTSVIRLKETTATYHNDGYVNASTDVVTPIASTANYFYSDLIEVKKGETVTVSYKDTLDVVWILSKWTDSSTFAEGILKGNSNAGVQTYSFTATSDMYIRHSARFLNDLDVRVVDEENIQIVAKAIALEAETTDYGFLLNSFLKIGAVGDSLASGECISGSQGSAVANDLYEHSWIQYMARFYGFVGVNFSKGGMTTRGWHFDDDYDHQGWTKAQLPENLCNCYIIGLGANDLELINNDPTYLGSPADIGTSNNTFYRNYARVISDLKSIQPKAKFFLFTLTWLYTETSPYDELVDDVNEAINYIAEHNTNCYVIDLDADRWYYGSDNTSNKRSGHYNAIGYNMQAMHLAKLIGNYMHSHQSEFRQIEFIGTDLSWTD